MIHIDCIKNKVLNKNNELPSVLKTNEELDKILEESAKELFDNDSNDVNEVTEEEECQYCKELFN